MSVCFAPGLAQSAPANTSSEAKGLILYAEPPTTYVEALEFTTLTRQSVRYTTLVRPTGQKSEIHTGGILATVPYPPSSPTPDTAAQASEQLKQIQALSLKYRQFQSKLEAVAAKWKSVATVAVKSAPAKPASAPAAAPTKPAGMAIVTTDGTRYEDVSVTKVEADVVSFSHSAGAAAVDLAQLPPDLQRKFNYDPKRAEAAKLAKKEAAEKAKTDAANPSLRPAEFRSGAKDMQSMAVAYGSPTAVIAMSKFEPGKAYRMTALKIQQAGSDFVLLYSSSKTYTGGISFDNNQLFGVMLFQNPDAIAGVRMQKDDMIDGVARFLEFREVPLTTRTERLPVFECVGFANLSTGGEFTNTEK